MPYNIGWAQLSNSKSYQSLPKETGLGMERDIYISPLYELTPFPLVYFSLPASWLLLLLLVSSSSAAVGDVNSILLP
jgi:hypothetical protein